MKGHKKQQQQQQQLQQQQQQQQQQQNTFYWHKKIPLSTFTDQFIPKIMDVVPD